MPSCRPLAAFAVAVLASCGGPDCGAASAKATAAWRRYENHQVSSAADALKGVIRGYTAATDPYPSVRSDSEAGVAQLGGHLERCAAAVAACDKSIDDKQETPDPSCALAGTEVKAALDGWDAMRDRVATALALEAGEAARDEAFGPIDAARGRAADAWARAGAADGIDQDLRAGKWEGESGRKRSGLRSIDPDASGFTAATVASKEFAKQCGK